jgi:hypothetical protein
MAGKNWPRGRGEAAHLSNLRITTDYLQPDYNLVPEDLTRGENRHLKVFSLLPSKPENPRFQARVDDGSPNNIKEIDLDIDIDGVSDALKRDFKAGRNGYEGHHTDRSPDREHRIFGVEIVLPSGKVFVGEVSFNAAFSVSSSMTAQSKVTVDATVTRAKGNGTN